MKRTAREIAERLFAGLWNRYLDRVPYARTYTNLLEQKHVNLIVDHVSFRTFNSHCGEQPEGIQAIRHIFDCLEYCKAESYRFKKKKLSAIHMEHPDKVLPKIFISQLEVNELPDWAQKAIAGEINQTPYQLSDKGIELLNQLKTDHELTAEAADVLTEDLLRYFKRPWKVPSKDTVLKLNDVSQYAAWVLLHGNSVSHFAALFDNKLSGEWPDLESVVLSMLLSDVPMMENIEGTKESKLRQTATFAVKEEVKVKSEDGFEKIPWTYACFELVQRNNIEEGGQRKLFSGFNENQERHLFGITTTHEN